MSLSLSLACPFCNVMPGGQLDLPAQTKLIPPHNKDIFAHDDTSEFAHDDYYFVFLHMTIIKKAFCIY